MREYNFAPFYDAFLYPFVNRLRKITLKIIKRFNPSRIIDVCCGTGNQLKLLLKHNYDVTGIDLSPEMLAIAKKGKYKPECLLMDATDIYFENDSFDAAIITFALHEKQKEIAEKMLKETHRILKKGGYLIVTDFIIDKKTFFLSKQVITLIESMAGKEHFTNFLAFKDFGGLKTLINRDHYNCIEKYFFVFHGVTIEVWQTI